jgi:tripartite-type tricarboxylate transporter receptor subunit TctC
MPREKSLVSFFVFLTISCLPPSWQQARSSVQVPASVTLSQATPSGPVAQRFYEGKTIRLIVATGSGTTSDIAARLVAPHLSRLIPGNPNIFMQNMPGAGGVLAANYLYTVAKPDGLTIAAMIRSNYLDQMVARSEVKFDFRKFGWIGSFNRAPMMIACRTDTGYTSIGSIRSVKTPPRFADGATSSIGFIFSELVAEVLDLKFKQILGFLGGGRALDLAMERGEADCRATSDITVIRPPWPEWIERRFVSFIVQQGPKKSGLLPQEVPSVYDLAPAGAKASLDLIDVLLAYTEFDRPYAAPPGVPREQLEILRWSFERMLHDAKFSADAKKLLDWDGSYLSGEQLKQKIEQTVTQPAEIIKRVKEILRSP